MSEAYASLASILSLCERLRRHTLNTRSHYLEVDLRLAQRHLKHFCSVLILDEAQEETDPGRKVVLESEACGLWVEASTEEAHDA